MDETPHEPSARAIANGMVGVGAVLVFDGKGGVVRYEPGAAKPEVPARGF